MVANQKRIQLLSQAEINELYAPPVFNEEERELYFSLDDKEMAAAISYGNPRTQLYFMLQLGYFKAKQQFYSFALEEVFDDASYLNTYYFDNKVTLSGKLSREYRSHQREKILAICYYQLYSKAQEEQTLCTLCYLLKIHPKAHSALRQLMIYFNQRQIVLPTYRTLQDLFTQAYRIERNRLNKLMGSLPNKTQDQLKALIKNDDGLTELNVLRADQKDFQYTAVRLEVEKANKIFTLYQLAKTLLPKTKLSKNAIQYYADMTEEYAAFRLRKLAPSRQWLHLLCFVYHRYQQFMDNLIISFMYHVRSTVLLGNDYIETAKIEHHKKLVVDFPKLAEFLRWFPSQKNRPDISYEKLSKEAYQILPEEQFIPLADLIKGQSFDDKAARWEFYGKASRTFSLYLRPILLAVDFQYFEKDHPITTLISILKKHYQAGKSPSALKLCDELGMTIPKSMLKYLKKDPQDSVLDPYRFEFYVYQKMYHHLDRGRLFCNDSVSFCDLNCDLVPESLVDEVNAIAEKYGFPNIPIFCDAFLDENLEKLDEAWQRTMDGINTGSNTGIHIKTENNMTTWRLNYDTSDPLDDQFLSGLPKVEMPHLISFIGNTVNMWQQFAHKKDLYIKRKQADPVYLSACILAEALGFSIEQMAEISNLNKNTLDSTHEDFFNCQALCHTNDAVSDFICALPIFKQWNLIDNQTLADADGQKIAATDQTLQSRHSQKFFGKGKGISIYTLLANFVAVNATNIGPNEYEGHSLYDMIYGNKTDISIDMVTGDGHSMNKYNFVFLASIGVSYVPSIKNIREAANELYATDEPDNYTGLLQPKGKINVERIRREKRAILRVLLSLLMQDNTQTTIVRKLNSHARYTRLRAALEEYNKLLKSTHVLNLIHDMALRKALKAARNRTESYHSLQGLIRKVNNGIFRGKKISNNRISAHATRLVANCIVAYNAIILNAIYENMLKRGASAHIIKEFARISPIAWSHLIFTGRYSFVKSDGKIDIERFVEQLEQVLWDKLAMSDKTPLCSPQHQNYDHSS